MTAAKPPHCGSRANSCLAFPQLLDLRFGGFCCFRGSVVWGASVPDPSSTPILALGDSPALIRILENLHRFFPVLGTCEIAQKRLHLLLAHIKAFGNVLDRQAFHKDC